MNLNKTMSWFLGVLGSLAFLTGCDSGSGPSAAEVRALQSSAFVNNFNVHDVVGDVISQDDALPASRPFHVDTLSEALEVPIRDCKTPGLYEMEKQMALNEAAADLTGQTVPVKFSYSFGRKHDVLAKWANKRAILSESNGGVSYIPVGGKLSSKYGKKHAYYEADNNEVARQYSTGEKCFFSTIHVSPDNFHISNGKYDFINVTEEDLVLSPELVAKKSGKNAKLSYLTHMIHYMYYGYCATGRCEKGQAFAGEFANRLFKEVPSYDNDEPQIIKLYVADLRSEQLQHDVVRLQEDTVRGHEIDSSIDNILNICKVHENFYDVTKNISLPVNVNGYDFDPINGAVQLMENILSHDVDGTMLSSQYTPIVIDLDGDGVKTSSLRWGTYFNMAALEDVDQQGQAHRTSWLGGEYLDHNQGSDPDPRVNMDVRLTATDGFLVAPGEDGVVTSSTEMFGDNIIVGGKTYENGFAALQAFAGKDCESDYVENRYVGPWDGDVYSEKLKIWVDQNRNGVSEVGEIKSLREHGIAAINACHIVHANEEDAFGNGTHMRSAVLMAGPYGYLLDSPGEIAHHLEFGKGYDGEQSYFNLAVDLIFQVNEDDRCPGGAMERTNHPAIDLDGDDVGISTGDPVPLPTDDDDGTDGSNPHDDDGSTPPLRDNY